VHKKHGKGGGAGLLDITFGIMLYNITINSHINSINHKTINKDLKKYCIFIETTREKRKKHKIMHFYIYFTFQQKSYS